MPARSSAAARRRVLALLKDDHREIVAAFDAIDALPPAPDREALAGRVDAALALLERHAALERAHLYPAVHGCAGERVDEAEVEHDAMATLVAQIRAGGPLDLKYLARVKVLAEYVRHHVREEEGALFAALEAAPLAWDELEAGLSAGRSPAPDAPRRRAPPKARNP